MDESKLDPVVTPLSEFDSAARISAWTRNRWIASGELPAPFRINGRTNGYATAEAALLLAALRSGLTRDERKQLAADIERARTERRQAIVELFDARPLTEVARAV